MTGATWATLLVTFAIAISTPGPDTFLLLRLGVRSRRAAVLAACGIMVGNTIWTLASLAGLSALLQAVPGALPALQVLGSAVLIYIGIMSIRGGLAGLRAEPEVQPMVGASVTAHPLRLGLVTNLSNPKALLFFTALFSQLLPADASLFERGAILVSLTALGLAWFVGFALLTSSSTFQRWFGRVAPSIDIVAGIVFLLVAAVILIELLL